MGIAESQRPLVGITGQRISSAEISTTPQVLVHAHTDAHYAHYAQAVARAGGMPVHLPRENPPEELVDRLDGLLVAGGHDIHPRPHHTEADHASSQLDPGRDRFELGLIGAALNRDKPLVGICRGAQLLNVALAGTLPFDLSREQQSMHSRLLSRADAPAHAVRFTPGSLMHRLYGDERMVNSFHRQAIGALGDRVIVTGSAPDGVVEAIEIERRRAVGVQWHPELLAGDDPLFAWLIGEAAAADTEVALSSA